MRKMLLTVTLASVVAPSVALAHPGHGAAESGSSTGLLHQLVEHGGWVALAGGALVLSVALLRRRSRMAVKTKR